MTMMMYCCNLGFKKWAKKGKGYENFSLPVKMYKIKMNGDCLFMKANHVRGKGMKDFDLAVEM